MFGVRECKSVFVFRMTVLLLATVVITPGQLNADVVTDWNQIMVQTVVTGTPSSLVSTRITAIVEAAVFDAVNGIERRYTPIHVDFAATAGASKRAAAVQAAYATLVVLYPSQKTALDAKRQASLAGIASNSAEENSVSIALGIQWGQTVANDIMAWRSTDGFTPPPPPFLGGLAIGEWRPTPPDFSPGAGPQFAYMTPWAISSPSQFRPAAPPALTSGLYATVFNEVKTMGSAFGFGPHRRPDRTSNLLDQQYPRLLEPDREGALQPAQLNLSDNARLFALLNVTMADAAIACWEAKYHYVFWRPITAINLAGLDGNPATDADPTWTPLLVITPSFPEYPSGHSTVSAAAAAVLAAYFGNATSFSIDSEKLRACGDPFSASPKPCWK